MDINILLADVIIVVHLLYMAIVVFGQLAIMIGHHLGWQWVRNPWFRSVHLAMILYVAYEAVEGIECPLTKWERDYRIEGGQIPPDDVRGAEWEVANPSFVARVARAIMMCDSRWQPILDASYYFFAGLVVATWILVPPRLRRNRPRAPDPTALATGPRSPEASG
jgi:Protein of Unknown function (DUF2784)